MAQKEEKLDLSYGIIIFSLGFVAWGVSKLLVLQNVWANWIASVLVFLSAITCVTGIIHYWRYGMHK
jgi:hypothetical protein